MGQSGMGSAFATHRLGDELPGCTQTQARRTRAGGAACMAGVGWLALGLKLGARCRRSSTRCCPMIKPNSPPASRVTTPAAAQLRTASRGVPARHHPAPCLPRCHAPGRPQRSEHSEPLLPCPPRQRSKSAHAHLLTQGCCPLPQSAAAPRPRSLQHPRLPGH